MFEWQLLGVFAMVGEGEEKLTNLFLLAIDMDGVIGGENYNALTDEASPMRRSVDKNTQRAAWTEGDKKFPAYEAGYANLTKEKYQQFTVLRLQSPEGDQPPDGKWCS